MGDCYFDVALALGQVYDDVPALLANAISTDFAPFRAASTGDQTAALNRAADEIDRCMRYQGRKYLVDQDREFPRIANESSRRSLAGIGPVGPVGPGGMGVADEVWDWDWNNNIAIVPPFVLMANLLQADFILIPGYDRILNAQHQGVQGAGTGSMREEYREGAPGMETGFARRAYNMLRRYKLKYGRIL